MSILGIDYVVPPRLAVSNFQQRPGVTHMIFEDNITRCDGDVLFETVGDYSKHDAFVKSLAEEREELFSRSGLTYTSKESQVTMHGTDARKVVFSLQAGEDAAKHSIFDVHLPWRHLSIVSEITCTDPALLESQLQAVRAFLGTGRQGGESLDRIAQESEELAAAEPSAMKTAEPSGSAEPSASADTPHAEASAKPAAASQREASHAKQGSAPVAPVIAPAIPPAVTTKPSE